MRPFGAASCVKSNQTYNIYMCFVFMSKHIYVLLYAVIKVRATQRETLCVGPVLSFAVRSFVALTAPRASVQMSHYYTPAINCSALYTMRTHTQLHTQTGRQASRQVTFESYDAAAAASAAMQHFSRHRCRRHRRRSRRIIIVFTCQAPSAPVQMPGHSVRSPADHSTGIRNIIVLMFNQSDESDNARRRATVTIISSPDHRRRRRR